MLYHGIIIKNDQNDCKAINFLMKRSLMIGIRFSNNYEKNWLYIVLEIDQKFDKLLKKIDTNIWFAICQLFGHNVDVKSDIIHLAKKIFQQLKELIDIGPRYNLKKINKPSKKNQVFSLLQTCYLF